MFASFSASIWAWARTNLFFFGDLLGRCIVFARSVYPCSHCSPCPVVSCLPAVPFAMACYLWLLLVAVFVSPVLSMYHSRSRKQTHGWRDRGGDGGWQGSQDRSGLHGRLDKLEMLVEEAVKGKKKKKKRSKKKSSSSSSSSSSPNDKKARKQKREKKSKSEPRGLKAALEPFLPRKRRSCWSFVVRLKWTSCEPRSVLRWRQRELCQDTKPVLPNSPVQTGPVLQILSPRRLVESLWQNQRFSRRMV